MSSQRYERVSANDDENYSPSSPSHPQAPNTIPGSPPPSFRSRASSPTHRQHTSEHVSLVYDADRTLADTFDSPSDDGEEDETDHPALDERQRVMSGRPVSSLELERSQTSEEGTNRPIETRVTQLPGFDAPAGQGRRVQGGGNGGHDGVFANLNAKPERGEDAEEKPPSYETAAADAAPPYWETTIIAPGGSYDSSAVFIDGLPVGSVFSFVWNGLISMSFQLVGFLLTYLLHTTHAAKNGSKAGLGITLVQYGFSMSTIGGNNRRIPTDPADPNPLPGADGTFGSGPDYVSPPSDPNAHDFDPAAVTNMAASSFALEATAMGGSDTGGLHASDWLAYAIMVVGWFVLIRAISEYLKARRHEQLVMQSPSRGLNVPVVGDGEEPVTAV